MMSMHEQDEAITVRTADLDPPRTATSADAYLEWQPAQHTTECPRPEWQVRTYLRYPVWDDGLTVEGLRAYCTSCGVQYEMAAQSGWRDSYDDAHGPTVSRAPSAYRGHQAQPVKVAGLWMHGEGRPVDRPRLSDTTRTWAHYYVTASPAPPEDRKDIIGLVSVQMSPRGATRWAAALMRPSESGRLLEPVAKAERLFEKPTSAARWIANNRPTSEGGDL